MAPLAFAVMISATVLHLFEEVVSFFDIDTNEYGLWIDLLLVLICFPAGIVIITFAFASKNIPNRAESAVTTPVGVILGTVASGLCSEIRTEFIGAGVTARPGTDDGEPLYEIYNGGMYFLMAFTWLVIINIIAVAMSAWGALIVEKQDILEQAIVDEEKAREIRARAAFLRIDDDQSGRLREDEIRDVFDKMQTETQKFDESQLTSMTKEIMAEVDTDKNGWLEEEEFVKAMADENSTINVHMRSCNEIKASEEDNEKYSPMMHAFGKVMGSTLAVPVAMAWSAIGQEFVLKSLTTALTDSCGGVHCGNVIGCGIYGLLAHIFAVTVNHLYLWVKDRSRKYSMTNQDHKSFISLKAQVVIIEKMDFFVSLTLLFFIRFSYYTIVSYTEGLHGDDDGMDFNVDFLIALGFFILCGISAQVKVWQGKTTFPIGIELMISTLPMNFGAAFKSVYLDPVAYMDKNEHVGWSVFCTVILLVELGLLAQITVKNIQNSKDIIMEEFRADIRVGQLVHKAKAIFLEKMRKCGEINLTIDQNPLQASETFAIEKSNLIE
eukprot:CAMPEP_0185752466 /NCGR_PEP_ID=MMETSP1174-20130828/11269_1 /TAXON_ID=35687 /ORGANISM="Dictyocha speculum, Strain CCMP1381" /LENGTH=551 /DNA_ID=CAMNT_0028429935 /DNA_START=89 /DNA_END=1744 /DNA_ORIENTATION=+